MRSLVVSPVPRVVFSLSALPFFGSGGWGLAIWAIRAALVVRPALFLLKDFIDRSKAVRVRI
jgi:hypothetical protein